MILVFDYIIQGNMKSIYNNNKGLEYMVKDIKELKTISSILDLFGIKNEILGKSTELEEELLNLIKPLKVFINIFNDRGWIVSNSMNNDVIKKTVEVYESDSIEEAEKILINYYTNEDNLKNIYSILRIKYIKYAKEWNHLIEKAFEYHLNKEYISSVPLFLIIIDGVIAKFTKSHGFFSEPVDLEVKESFLYEQIQTVKDICYSSRKKINEEEIYIPYRNGILHGKDLNFANEYVSSKLVNLFTSILDWIDDKTNEQKRIDELKKREELENKSIGEIFQELTEYRVTSKKNNIFFNNWDPEHIIFSDNRYISKDNTKILPKNGTLEDYKGYPYLQALVSFLIFWKKENYGYLAKYIKVNARFKKNYKDELNNPGLVNEIFRNYKLIDYKIKNISLNAPAMKKIDVNLNIEVSKDIYDSLDYNDDRSIDVEFRVLSKSDYDSELISEQIKKSDWVIDSDFFFKMI